MDYKISKIKVIGKFGRSHNLESKQIHDLSENYIPKVPLVKINYFIYLQLEKHSKVHCSLFIVICQDGQLHCTSTITEGAPTYILHVSNK